MGQVCLKATAVFVSNTVELNSIGHGYYASPKLGFKDDVINRGSKFTHEREHLATPVRISASGGGTFVNT